MLTKQAKAIQTFSKSKGWTAVTELVDDYAQDVLQAPASDPAETQIRLLKYQVLIDLVDLLAFKSQEEEQIDE